ncbi:protein ripply2-like protein [Turdus rufiventris]|nr:protein ripply2-like protein [Turdus rufiventris]
MSKPKLLCAVTLGHMDARGSHVCHEHSTLLIPQQIPAIAPPPKLFWPKSRCYDYLYQEAEALLKNFPVQATISFYEDSDSEDDEDELEQDSRTESSC